VEHNRHAPFFFLLEQERCRVFILLLHFIANTIHFLLDIFAILWDY
jgi:hypothetical protein